MIVGLGSPFILILFLVFFVYLFFFYKIIFIEHFVYFELMDPFPLIVPPSKKNSVDVEYI